MYYWIALWFIFPKAFVSFQVEELSKILHCGRNEDNTKSDVEVQTEDHAPWSISGIQCLVGMHESSQSIHTCSSSVSLQIKDKIH